MLLRAMVGVLGALLPTLAFRVRNTSVSTGFRGFSPLAPAVAANSGFAAAGIQWAVARYSFASHGGAVGAISLLPTDDLIPANAVILGGYANVVTAPTSGGAGTLAIGVEAAGDMIAAAAVSGAPWSTTGRKSVIPVWTGTSTVKTTVARQITATVATAALTAGIVDVYLAYVVHA